MDQLIQVAGALAISFAYVSPSSACSTSTRSPTSR